MAVEPSQRHGIQSTLIGLIQGMLEPLRKEPPPPPQPAMGFFTDTSLCIGCKACEVACKQWNQLPANDPVWTGSSYDNTGQLSATTWRHVLFIEHIGRPDIPLIQSGTESMPGSQSSALPFFNSDRW